MFTLASFQAEAQPLAYPDTPTIAHIDEYFGEKVADPYR